MIQISTVLFDLGNVIAYIDFDAFWRSLGFYTPEEKAPFIDGYKLWTRKYETGSISTNNYLDGLQTVFNSRFDLSRLERAFASIMLEPIDGMHIFIEKISHTHQTALVSNTNDIHYKLSLERYKTLKLLGKRYLSYQLGVMKPDKKFYNAIIEDQNVYPSELLFIDDLSVNVEGAKSVGMNAIKFESLAQLQNEFRKLGVITA